MVSLPVSFLTLVWASTVADEVLHSDGHFRVKDKVLIFFHVLIYFKHSTLCSCFVHCKLQLVGYHCFDPSPYGDDDI